MVPQHETQFEKLCAKVINLFENRHSDFFTTPGSSELENAGSIHNWKKLFKKIKIFKKKNFIKINAHIKTVSM